MSSRINTSTQSHTKIHTIGVSFNTANCINTHVNHTRKYMALARTTPAWPRHRWHDVYPMASHNRLACTPAITPRCPFRDAPAGMFIPGKQQTKKIPPLRGAVWRVNAAYRCGAYAASPFSSASRASASSLALMSPPDSRLSARSRLAWCSATICSSMVCSATRR